MNQLINSWQDFSIAFVLVLAWSLLWKGWALWRAAQKSQKIWFVALLIVNTVGILDILYIFIFSSDETIKKIKGVFSGTNKTVTPPTVPPSIPSSN
jgi:hypothetical protein